MPSIFTTTKPISVYEENRLPALNCLGTYESWGPAYISSITGYFLEGSKSLGLATIPQIPVFPSLPLAVKTSGGSHPLAKSSEMSDFSKLQTSAPSETLLNSFTGAISIREY